MLFLAVFLCYLGTSFGCQPMIIHYQTTYCSASVAAVVKIDSEKKSAQLFAPELEYMGTLLDSVKGTSLPPGTRVTVTTAGPLHSCGPLPLTVGDTYMILGKEDELNRLKAKVFNGARKLSDKDAERKLKEQFTVYDCTCRVLTERYGPRRVEPRRVDPRRVETEEEVGLSECRASSQYGCQWNEGACVRTRQGGRSRCTYVHNCPE